MRLPPVRFLLTMVGSLGFCRALVVFTQGSVSSGAEPCFYPYLLTVITVSLESLF